MGFRELAGWMGEEVQRGMDHGFEARVREYWDWIAITLFLLTTVDMTTTMYAAFVVGPGAEANPVIRWVLNHGLPALVAVNLVAVVLVVVMFYGLVEMLRATPDPYDQYFAVGIEVWLGGLLAAGLVVFANNLTVIVHGRSLI